MVNNMSVKYKKRKVHKHSQHSVQSKKGRSTLLMRHPRLFLSLGILLLIISGLVFSVGYLSDAKIGLSMLTFFFGMGFALLSNAALPKKSLK